MESNEISMFMDAKLDIHSKKPESVKYKTWTRCMVKIEAIKCVPSYLRLTLTRNFQIGVSYDDCIAANGLNGAEVETPLCFSINVPGVSVSPTESRTKQHSYGLFWKQNRRDCFIYFAIETEASHRRHIKWIKRSIKNLELHRLIFLEQRRNSRGPGVGRVIDGAANTELLKKVLAEQQVAKSKQFSCSTNTDSALGPLPKTPDLFDSNNSTWSSKHVSRVSEIYEEIFENYTDLQQQLPAQPRISRRFSRTSIASGIYEEMKPTTTINYKSIDEEIIELEPPPLPPLPSHRKRINTFDKSSVGVLGDIPRSNTNPESEMAKKKKYKNIIDNIFGGVTRSKRAESVSESATCSIDDLVKEVVYENSEVAVAAKRQKKPPKTKTPSNQPITKSNRNSFSSPDLSKINFLETFDEERIASMLLQNSFASSSDDLRLSIASLDESSIHPILRHENQPTETLSVKPKTESAESLNISQQIPLNFNFSACNTSSINLVGASGATLLQTVPQKNNIFIDDLTGYCIMAPIKNKPCADSVSGSQQSTSSGYSTGSYSSSAASSSSCTNSTEDNAKARKGEKQALSKPKNEIIGIAEESTIYENMVCGGSPNLSTITGDINLTGNLYENILSVKATQEQTSAKDDVQPKMSTSTPTGLDVTTEPHVIEEPEENYYQTPRKSIICVDDKIPSYYPNDCDVSKLRRHSHSPIKTSPTSTLGNEKSSSGGIRQFVSAKIRRDRKENYYVTFPKQQQQKSEQKQSPKSTNKSKKSAAAAAAHKISDHVYAVNHNSNKKSNYYYNNNNNNTVIDPQAKIQNELLQLAALQKIDFKFDDSNKSPAIILSTNKNETENCLSPKESASRILHKYATLARAAASPSSSSKVNVNAVISPNHHLQQNQQLNTQEKRAALTASDIKLESNITTSAVEEGNGRKFGSLPRFKKIDFSPLRLRINNVLQRNQHPPQL